MNRTLIKNMLLAASLLGGLSPAWGTECYDPTGFPAQGSAVQSAPMRAEFAAIQPGISNKPYDR